MLFGIFWYDTRMITENFESIIIDYCLIISGHFFRKYGREGWENFQNGILFILMDHCPDISLYFSIFKCEVVPCHNKLWSVLFSF